jgi:hypothetical protein
MRRLVVRLSMAALATLGLVIGPPSRGASAATVPSLAHVFVLIGENKDFTQMTSTPSRDPYILQTLKPESAWFTGYNSTTTGSLADYIALTSGQFAACQRQGPCGQFAADNIFHQLSVAGKSWRDWNESMPANCYSGKSGSLTTWNYYKNGHNPVLFYSDVSSTTCKQLDVPTGSTGPNDMTTFNAALAAGTVPVYNFVSPNGCEAGYQDCYGYDGFNPAIKMNPITEFDNFLKKEVPAIQKSPACTDPASGANTKCLIVATLDEGGPTRGTPTMLAVTGAGVKPGSYGGYYDHYSTLRTIEDGLGVPCTNYACGSTYSDFTGVTRQAADLPIF